MTRPWGLIVLSLGVLAGCRKGEPPHDREEPPAPVAVAKAEVGSVPVTVRSVGNVRPVASVTLRPQVSGRVIELPAGEGVEVGQGDPLVVLDERPFQSALDMAQAAATRDRAMAADARAAADQYASALAEKAVAQRSSEEAQAKARAAEAAVVADEAAVRAARLDLEYCRIAAPFTGRLGALQVKVGDVVKENETDLINIAQVDPIEVAFAIPEERLPGVRAGEEGGTLSLRADIPGDSKGPVLGKVTFIDNAVDMASGTIRLKATFDNADRRLWPGQFVNVVLTLSRQENVVLVPSDAVVRSQDGQSVFVITPGMTAEERGVTTGISSDARTVIVKGVSAGETVVTDGQLLLETGARVRFKQAQAERGQSSRSDAGPAR